MFADAELDRLWTALDAAMTARLTAPRDEASQRAAIEAERAAHKAFDARRAVIADASIARLPT